MKRIIIILVSVFTVFGIKAQDNTDVLHYSINLNVNNIINNGHTGFTDIEMLILEDNPEYISFMLKSQVVDSIINMNDTTALVYSYENPNINISCPPYQIGDTLKIRVYYHGGQVLEGNSTPWGGFHYEGNLIYTIGVAFADYPHSYARSWFVAKDVFDDKATYDLNITVSNNVQAQCSGILDSITDSNNQDGGNEGNHTYHYTIPQEIAPYLVSMTIGNFNEYASTIHSSVYDYDIPLRVYYTNSSLGNVIEDMFERVPLAFDTLEKSFGRYAFNRVGYCVTPIGSMEHVDNISLASGALTGEISGMSNIVHEMAHSWFGNNITCKTEKDMWLNEGWTSFTTRLSLSAIYGEQATRDFFRDSHEEVLTSVARREGYFPVNEADSTQTYSSTVYDKGALIVISLKEYLGDSLFYAAVKDMIANYRFSNVSSEIVRDYLSQRTSKDLNSFFDCMVFSSSTPHYEIAQKTFNNNSATLNIKQRAYPEPDKTLLSSRMPVTFFDNSFNTCKRYVEFSSDDATITISDLPFSPTNAMIDYDEEFMDLTTDYAQMIKVADTTYQFPNTYFRLKTNNISDSSLVRATLHWIGEEDQENLPYGVNRLSAQHYWTIEGINIDSEQMQGMFRYEIASYSSGFDTTLATESSQRDSIIMLYRRDHNSEWMPMPFSPINGSRGYMKTDVLLDGEYTMAMGDLAAVGLENVTQSKYNIRIYPNPTENITNIECSETTNAKLYNIDGRFLKEYMMHKGKNILDLSLFNENSFIISFYDKKGKVCFSRILLKK